MKQHSLVGRTKSHRYGGSAAPVVVAMALFAIVLGYVCYWGLSQSETKIVIVEDQTTDILEETQATDVPDASFLDEPKSNDPVLDFVAKSDQENKAVDPSINIEPVISTPEKNLPIQTVSIEKPQPVEKQIDIQGRVQARLDAGEFAPAMEIARKETNNEEQRTRLFQMIARTQMNVGELSGAFAAIRRIPASPERDVVHNEQVQEQALAGGAAQADFSQLMALIQSQTSGIWSEDGEEDGGTMTPYNTGILVDPNGLLHLLSKSEKSDRLKALGTHARKADLNAEMMQTSNLRLVSLARLEHEIARRQKAGLPTLETMKQLAGLSQIKYVFIYPEVGDVVIGGPAEAWEYNAAGIPQGVQSGRPTLQLDDFVTVLRTFSKGGNGAFQCLIVPRKENMKKVQEYANASNSKGSLRSTKGVRNFVKQIEKRLGEQDVVYNGVPRDSRVARVILDADYKMKLIGINRLEEGGIKSYFDLLPPAQQKSGATNTALRWWLTMKYDAVLHSDDHHVFEIQGASVLCQSENEFITSQGNRVHTGKAEPTNQAFANGFTHKYAELCKEDFAFADLQNVFDLSLVAALLNHERVEGRLKWNAGVFAKGNEYQPKKFAEVQTVPSAVNYRIYKGGNIVVQAAGGVKGDLNSVIANPKVFKHGPRLGNMSKVAVAPKLPAGRWWWDAKSK